MKKRIPIGGLIGMILLAGILTSGLLAPVLAPYDPNAINMADSLQGFSKAHLLGTDLLGRDMLSRVLYGGKNSMLLAFLATAATMLLGMAVGTAAGYFGGACDWMLTSVTNIFQGLPGTSIMVAIAGIWGPSFQSLMIALILTGWTGFSRVVRMEVMRLREENYIDALRCLGGGSFYIIRRHILPNLRGNAMVLFTTRIGRCVLSIASLSFLGLGIQPPDPDWSVMINDARMNFRSASHLIVIPGSCIVLLLMSVNLIGDMLRDRLDVHSGEVRDL